MTPEEIAEKLGGEIGGHIAPDGSGYRWTCVCGDTDTAGTEQQASLNLFAHRQHKHVRQQ